MDAFFCFDRATNFTRNTKIQNHEIPYGTATWSIVEDASEPAPFLSVAANNNVKGTHTFALIERGSLQKTIEHQHHKIPYSTVTWDSVPVALVAASWLCFAAVSGFYNFAIHSWTGKIARYRMVRRCGTAFQSLQWRLPACGRVLLLWSNDKVYKKHGHAKS